MKRPPLRKFNPKQQKEVEIAKRYLRDAQANLDEYHGNMTGEIGRALIDIRDHAQMILDYALVGVSFNEVCDEQRKPRKRGKL